LNPKSPIPPKLAQRFLHWFLRKELAEEVEGDLEEQFYAKIKETTIVKAKLNYWYQVLNYLRPFAIRRSKQVQLIYLAMLRSYFITAFRNLKKNNVYTAINVLGLALGIACCLVVFKIVLFESSFDNYHKNLEDIYRVNVQQQNVNGRPFNGCNYTPLAEVIKREVSGLEVVSGVYCLYDYQINIEKEVFKDKYAFFADQAYFDVFDVAWIKGNQQLALTAPNTVVITDEFAQNFLGGLENALGSTFKLGNKLDLTVTGIVKSPPPNTDHPYSLLISFSSLAEFLPETIDNWEKIGNSATYVVFREDTNQKQIYNQFNTIIDKYLSDELAKKTSFFLMPLADNHDRNYNYNNFTYDFPTPVMVLLSIISGLIAFIACINFVNLATAQSLKRAKEVGLRKTLGSNRFQLILQFISEAFIITSLAMLMGMLIAKYAMIQLNMAFGVNHMQFDFVQEPSILIFIIGLTLLITLLAGFYPAFVLSNYKPIWAIKAQTHTKNPRGFSLRRALVVIQFIGVQLLIIVAFIVIDQVNHIKERPLSFDPKTVLTFPISTETSTEKYAILDHELRKIPDVLSHTFTIGPPFINSSIGARFYAENEEDNKQVGLLNFGDDKYLETFNLTLLAGSNFLSNSPAKSSEVLVNETLVKALGIAQPELAIGTIYTIDNEDVKIRGVFNDTHTNLMTSHIDPVTIKYDATRVNMVALNITTAHLPETLDRIEDAWEKAYPGYIFEYSFLDEKLNQQFGFFQGVFKLLSIAAIMAMVIGCLGLYGLVSFMAVQRHKEIGIRKVLGAAVSSIIYMFTKETILLLTVSFIMAAPMAYFLGTLLLMELPEKVVPGVGIFILTYLGSLAIAWLTVGYQSYKAAIKRPVESLQSE